MSSEGVTTDLNGMTRTWSFIRDGTSADTGSEPRRWSSGGPVKTPALGLAKVSKLGVRENRLASMGTSTGSVRETGVGACARKESTDVYNSRSSPVCASSTAPANVVCRWCTAVVCHLPGRGLLHRRKQIDFAILTRRERWFGGAQRRTESHDGVGDCCGVWWRRRWRQRPRGFLEALRIAVEARERKFE